MILFKNYRERLILLEYENKMLSNKINEMAKQMEPIKPQPPQPRIIREDGWDLSYDTLRRKYRDYDVSFKDGF